MIKKQILDIIAKYQSFLIVSHIHPEGDAIGSQLAMASLLKAMGKSVRIINADNVPSNLKFLPGVNQIEDCSKVKADEINFEAVIILDCPVIERIGDVREFLDKKPMLINIDHHISNTQFGEINWIDSKASSAGEMIYYLFKSSNVKLDDESALNLYVAVMTDTGSFHYSNTTAQTHKIAAELLNYNIDPTKTHEYIYETKSFETIKMLAEVLMNLERTKDGKFVWFKVTNDMLKRNKLLAESTEYFIDFVRMIEGTQVVAFLRELNSDNKVKISLRSKSEVDVNKIAKYFGGGGHFAASGCIIEKGMDEAEKLILREVKKAINDLTA